MSSSNRRRFFFASSSVSTFSDASRWCVGWRWLPLAFFFGFFFVFFDWDAETVASKLFTFEASESALLLFLLLVVVAAPAKARCPRVVVVVASRGGMSRCFCEEKWSKKGENVRSEYVKVRLDALLNRRVLLHSATTVVTFRFYTSISISMGLCSMKLFNALARSRERQERRKA